MYSIWAARGAAINIFYVRLYFQSELYKKYYATGSAESFLRAPF
jgi:hypothetical protein